MTVKCTTWELIAFRAELSFKIFNFGWNFVNVGKTSELQWTKFCAFGISRNAKFRTQNFAKLRNFAVVENMNQFDKFFGRIFILPTRL